MRLSYPRGRKKTPRREYINPGRKYADNERMKLGEIIPVITGVLLHPYVIGTAIVIILYCNFVSYVARYKKKPPKPKKKKIVEAAPTPAQKAEGEEGGEQAEEASAEE